MVGSIDFQAVDAESKAHAGTTDTDGVAIFNPFKKGKYDVTVKLKDEQKNVYQDPQAKSGTVGDKEEVALVNLKLKPDTVTPKLEVENDKAWFHKEKDVKTCTAVEVQLWLEEDRPALAYAGEGKLTR